MGLCFVCHLAIQINVEKFVWTEDPTLLPSHLSHPLPKSLLPARKHLLNLQAMHFFLVLMVTLHFWSSL